MGADVEAFRRSARDWLAVNATPPGTSGPEGDRGSGADDLAIFHDLPYEAERALILRAMRWQQRRFDAGFGAITWPEEYGGAGLGPEFADAYAEEEARFEIPRWHELFSVTVHLVAPTI